MYNKDVSHSQICVVVVKNIHMLDRDSLSLGFLFEPEYVLTKLVLLGNTVMS